MRLCTTGPKFKASSHQRVEHYEIAAYGCVRTWADLLGENEASALLDKTLEEEKEADEKLTQIGEEINVQAKEEGSKDEEGEEGEEVDADVALAERVHAVEHARAGEERPVEHEQVRRDAEEERGAAERPGEFDIRVQQRPHAVNVAVAPGLKVRCRHFFWCARRFHGTDTTPGSGP